MIRPLRKLSIVGGTNGTNTSSQPACGRSLIRRRTTRRKSDEMLEAMPSSSHSGRGISCVLCLVFRRISGDVRDRLGECQLLPCPPRQRSSILLWNLVFEPNLFIPRHTTSPKRHKLQSNLAKTPATITHSQSPTQKEQSQTLLSAS